jgi:tryptophan synthase alpha chain
MEEMAPGVSPMNRLVQCLSSLRAKNKKALSLFLTAGYPAMDSTPLLVTALEHAGADIIELGIPFSDPIADGPTIQMSSEQALRNGMTLDKTLSMVKEVRKHSSIPLVLMGYANSFYAYGMDRFFSGCRDYGVDGVIIPDLPLEESTLYRQFASHNNVASIFLASPTTPDDRLRELDRASTGFLYCISVTGVTGVREVLANQAETFLHRARNVVHRNPLLAGFGISTPEDAKLMARTCDGIIIGSALINVISNGSTKSPVDKAVEFTKPIRDALDNLN